ncbi:TPA: hypothetical protein I7714_01365 [Vibrio vulnificus]|nr:hypothetical protein [Vibrio vulnificus]HAS8502592.1 hypothetical protein [Vibrio vulnificus]
MTLIAGLNFMIFIGLIFLISRFFQSDFSLSYKIKKPKINTLMKLIWLTFRRHRALKMSTTLWRFDYE